MHISLKFLAKLAIGFSVALMLLVYCSQLGAAQRIKDLASVQGVRSNQLVGFGLVVGLPGTGETSPFTEQSFRTMLSNFGISLDANVKPKIKNVKSGEIFQHIIFS